MNALLARFFALPIELQLGLMFVVGLVLGGQVNRGIYRLAFDKRQISPWSSGHPESKKRHWSDRLPVIGWLGLQRDESLHGRRFWLRPLVIELFCGVGLAALYYWQVHPHPNLSLFARFLSHASLLGWLAIATFIDFDERTIPDGVTVPGTIIGLLFASKLPASLLPIRAGGILLMPAPHPWPLWLHGKKGLLIGVACFLAWCFALLHKTWFTRHGIVKALRYAWASIFRSAQNKRILIMALVGIATINLVWSLGGLRWAGLLSALVGVVFGGGFVWAVRIVGGWGAGREAMGFGDVTLMAMIGAYLGWQPTLMVFFLAPFAGIAITIFHKLTSTDAELAFGPFLSLGTLVLLIFWPSLWTRWEPIYGLGTIIPAALVVMLAFLGLSLRCIRWVRGGELG